MNDWRIIDETTTVGLYICKDTESGDEYPAIYATTAKGDKVWLHMIKGTVKPLYARKITQ